MADSSYPVICTQCKSPLPSMPRNSGRLLACAHCGNTFRIDLYPALHKPYKTKPPQQVTEASQATCFNHENYQAEVACSGCGRFLCGLCDIRFHGGHHCVNCISQLKEESSKLVRTETGWASIAVLILFFSMMLWFLSFLLIPAALFLYFKKGRSPMRVLPPPWYEVPGVLIMAVLSVSAIAMLIRLILS